MVKYSFCTLSMNNADEVDRILSSIRSQKIKDYEIIVVDKSSDDSVKKLCKKYRARYVRQRRRGYPDARNLGLKNAKGEWVIWVDSDHWFDTNYLLNLDKCIKQHPDADVIITTQLPVSNTFFQHVCKAEWGVKRPFLPTVVKRKLLLHLGGWDPNQLFGEDRLIEQKINSSAKKIERCEKAVRFISLIDDFRSFIKQSRRYVREGLFNYALKYDLRVLLFMLYHFFMPLVIIFSPFISVYLFYTSCLLLLFESLIYVYKCHANMRPYSSIVEAKCFYGIFVPFLKIVRSWTQILTFVFESVKSKLKV